MSFQSLLVTADDTPALLSACRERLAGVRGQFNLGLVYFSDVVAADAEGIVEALRLASGIDHWTGGVALGVCGAEGEVFDRPALSLLLARLPDGAYKVFGPGGDPRADREVERWCARRPPFIGVVHADPREPDVPALLAGLGSGLAPFLVGGLLSSRSGYPQCGERVGEGALSGVLLTDEVAVVTRLSQGCSPVGGRRTVTRAAGNHIFSLDGEPVVEVLTGVLDAAGGARELYVARLRPESDTGDYLVRNILGVSEDRESLVVADEFTDGDTLMFCRRDADGAEADLRRMLESVRAALPSPARGALYVSCLARGPSLFREPGLETRLIREHLGPVPMAGFFANGEIAGDRLYGYTGVLTVFC